MVDPVGNLGRPTRDPKETPAGDLSKCSALRECGFIAKPIGRWLRLGPVGAHYEPVEAALGDGHCACPSQTLHLMRGNEALLVIGRSYLPHEIRYTNNRSVSLRESALLVIGDFQQVLVGSPGS